MKYPDQKIMRLWVKALRSGKYPQTTNRLRDNKGFCCLGVLCDIIDSTKWVPFNDNSVYGYDGYTTDLPPSITESVGIGDTGQLFKANTSLSIINDSGLHDFNVIADIIEAEFIIEKWYMRLYLYIKFIIKRYFTPWKKWN